MSYDEEYRKRSDTLKGFEEKARKVKKEGFGGRISPTGYTDTLVGMDDIDRMRRIKFNKEVNNDR